MRRDTVLRCLKSRETDADAVQEFRSKSRKTSSITEKQVCTKKCKLNSKKRARKTKEKSKARNKGKTFRSTLPSSVDLDDNSSDETQLPSLETSEKSDEKGYSAPLPEIKRDTTSVINVDNIPTEEIPQGIEIFSKVLRRDDNFRYPRRMLAEATFPDVDGTLTSFTLSANQSKLTDSITVKTLPPHSVLEDIDRELRTSEE